MGGEIMTPARLSRILSSQSAVAQKVFAALPAYEAWTIQQIRAVLEARGRHLAHHVIEGCLHSLQRAGLVDFIDGGFRAAFDAAKPDTVTPSQVADQEEASMTAALEITIHQSASVSISAPAVADAAPEPSGIQVATDRIAAIAVEVVDVVAGVHQQLQKLTRLSSELDELAIHITLETDQVSEKIEKLRKVQALLCDLGVAG